MSVPSEKTAVKKWLRELRSARGYTQAELAEIVGVDTRTILNAEKKTGGLPQGLAMLRLLQALGVVADAPAAETGGLTGRLQGLEEAVTVGFEESRGAIASLADDVAELARRLPPEAEGRRQRR